MEKKLLKLDNKKNNLFVKTAKQLVFLVGQTNFNEVFNCFSRVRFHIINRDLVDIEAIKKLELVKGVNWNGNELQVIIGPNAYKIKDAIHKLNNFNSDFELKDSKNVSQKEKTNLWNRFIGAANGIIVPILPLIIASGMVSGLTSILSSANVIVTYGPDGSFVTDMDWFSGLMYILSHSATPLLAIFFCYSTVKYMKGDGVMGFLIGILIASRFFLTAFSKGEIKPGEWKLFEWNGIEYSIKHYDNNVFPAVGAALLYVYIDRFIKKWMPGQVDLVFRPFLSLISTFFLAFFLVLPILGIIETQLAELAGKLYEIPYGIGYGAIGFLYMPMILTGIAWPATFVLEAPYFRGEGPLRFAPMIDAGTIAMLGTLLAVWLHQAKMQEKAKTVSAMAPLIFGVPEVSVYGVLLNRPKAFWLGNIGGAVIGIFAYFIDITKPALGGLGILEIIGYADDYIKILSFLGLTILGLGLNFLLVYFFANEKKSEIKLVKKSKRFIVNYTWLLNRKQKPNFIKMHQELNPILLQIKIMQKNNQEFYKTYLKYQKLSDKLDNQIKVFNEKQTKINSKMELLKEKNKSLESLAKKISALEAKFHKEQLSSHKIEMSKQQLDLKAKELENINLDTYNYSLKILDQFFEKYQVNNYQTQFKNKLWNSINDSLIITGYLEAKPDQMSKQDFYRTENKFFLKLLPKTF